MLYYSNCRSEFIIKMQQFLSKIVYVWLTFVFAAGFQYPDREGKYGFPKVKPRYPFNPYLPIALSSSNATPISLSPLNVYINKKAILQGQNIGFTVYTTPKDNNAGYITGGPFFNEKYIFAFIAQNNDGVPNNTRVSTTEDGKGFPVQIQLFYYNKKYRTFDTALNYPDGLAILLFNVDVNGVLDNKLFYPYQNLLKSVIQPNTTAPINAYDAVHWLYTTLKKDYYTYPGSFIDITTGKQYFCATAIESSFDTHARISYCQFQVFTEVLNQNYVPVANPLGLYPEFGRPICQVYGEVVVKKCLHD